MRFAPGGEYTFDQIVDSVFGDLERMRALGPEARFRYELFPGCDDFGYFDLVDEGPDPLIPGEGARVHVELLRAHGMTLREISRAAGLAFETVQRANSGVGRVRQSTQEALLQVASSLNGHG